MFPWQIDSSRWLREGIESNHNYFWVWAPLKVILSFSATRPKKMANIYLAVPFPNSEVWQLTSELVQPSHCLSPPFVHLLKKCIIPLWKKWVLGKMSAVTCILSVALRVLSAELCITSATLHVIYYILRLKNTLKPFKYTLQTIYFIFPK